MSVRPAAAIGAVAVVVGVAAGGAVRLAASGALAEGRASAAVLIVLGLAIALGPLGAFRRMGLVQAPTAAALAAAAAVLVAGGGPATVGAAIVVAGAAALAAGGAALASRCGADRGGAWLAGAAFPALLAGAVFVADPFVEWDGSGPASPGLARRIYAASPIAAATSQRGGTGVDWQTRRLMYDGHGGGGLSVIGQFYPARPPSALLWGSLALVAGLGLGALGGRRAEGESDADA